MKIKIFILAALLCFAGNIATAQYNFSKVDAWLAEHTGEMGGRTILMIYKDGKVIYSHTVNQLNGRQKMVIQYVANRQGKQADLEDYTPTVRQPVASCSKWYSAALVMTFVDEGKLQLTDTVGKYLPVLTKHGKGSITISDCLSHLTGIKAESFKESNQEIMKGNSMGEAMSYIANLPMEGEPGKTFHYSNTGLQIAGAILEKISGKSFETLFAERIAGPLNMQRTDFGKGKVAVPAGSAISTPQDYLNFLTMILNKGVFNGKRVLSENSIAQMQANRLTPETKIAYSPGEAGNFGYGYGEWVMNDQSVTSPGLFGSYPWVDNSKKYAAFLMCFYLKNTGRHERYVELKALVDESIK